MFKLGAVRKLHPLSCPNWASYSVSFRSRSRSHSRPVSHSLLFQLPHLTFQTPVCIARWSFVKHPTCLQNKSMRVIVRISTAIDLWLFLTLDDLGGRWVTEYWGSHMPVRLQLHADDLHICANEVTVARYKSKAHWFEIGRMQILLAHPHFH